MSFRIAVVSDTHLGSKFQQLSALRKFLRFAKREGAEEILHVGDLFEGRMSHRGSEFLRFLDSADEMVDYAVAKYPDTGLKTSIITGNHDISLMKESGYNPVRAVSQQRDDFKFIGNDEAHVSIHGVKFRLFHPGGSPGLAKSYRAQQEIWRNESSPDILLVGHFHFFNSVYEKGVTGINAACFQSQTPYEKGKNLHPNVGGVLLDIHNGKRVGVTYVPYDTTEQDW